MFIIWSQQINISNIQQFLLSNHTYYINDIYVKHYIYSFMKIELLVLIINKNIFKVYFKYIQRVYFIKYLHNLDYSDNRIKDFGNL